MAETVGRGVKLESDGLSARQVLVLTMLTFTITLAIVVGNRMSAEAMAVVVGMVCGVAAGIPTGLLFLFALCRHDRRRQEWEQGQAVRNGYPPVVVFQGGTPQVLPAGPQAGHWLAQAPGPPVQRVFHLVGGDDMLLQDGSIW